MFTLHIIIRQQKCQLRDDRHIILLVTLAKKNSSQNGGGSKPRDKHTYILPTNSAKEVSALFHRCLGFRLRQALDHLNKTIKRTFITMSIDNHCPHRHHHLSKSRNALLALASLIVLVTLCITYQDNSMRAEIKPKKKPVRNLDVNVSTAFAWSRAAELVAPKMDDDEPQEIWYQCNGTRYYSFIEKLQKFVLDRRQYHFNPPAWGDPAHQDLPPNSAVLFFGNSHTRQMVSHKNIQ